MLKETPFEHSLGMNSIIESCSSVEDLKAVFICFKSQLSDRANQDRAQIVSSIPVQLFIIIFLSYSPNSYCTIDFSMNKFFILKLFEMIHYLKL